ncbi:LSU ribosomal protein L6p (L9e) [Candidatus Phaeomarinobacter ectocarpi]|uniref:Large ribosomal subunit protein uL6 n=1 Tax=Candidatus Phaeomarinibacter ectocarpi TaxID=1458461 RepID=X5MFB7_9HYPH|nr:50S ribosomal protein L6 [Candidatus Phaeomarinobacter ectocarpi]CDO61492.1 LSU ribosomal protein L6p (L9e) [Candidatus Phaeomarinobacter ectocarpi]
MSRIGKMPIAIASGVTVTVDGQTVKAKGSKGELELTLVPEVTVSQGEDGLTVAPVDESQRARAMWGLSRSLVANMVQGVAEGFSKELEINGVGYRAEVQGKSLKLALGFSHDVIYPVPEGIEIKTPKPTEVVISGIDKQKVGQVAAEIRSYRPPEPYKGKGVKYVDEYIFRKEGKKK